MKKEWYRSKTIWSAVAMGIVGIAQLNGYVIPTEWYAILGSLGLYGLRDAIAK